MRHAREKGGERRKDEGNEMGICVFWVKKYVLLVVLGLSFLLVLAEMG